MSNITFNQLTSIEAPEKHLQELVNLFQKNLALTPEEADRKVASIFKFKSVRELNIQIKMAKEKDRLGKLIYEENQLILEFVRDNGLAKHLTSNLEAFLTKREHECINLSYSKQNYIYDYVLSNYIREYLEYPASPKELSDDICEWISATTFRLLPNLHEQVVEFVKHKIKYQLITSTGNLLDFSTNLRCYARYNIESKVLMLNEFWHLTVESKEFFSKTCNVENNVKQKFYVIERLFEALKENSELFSQVIFTFEVVNPEKFLCEVIHKTIMSDTSFDYNFSPFSQFFKKDGGYLKVRFTNFS